MTTAARIAPKVTEPARLTADSLTTARAIAGEISRALSVGH